MKVIGRKFLDGVLKLQSKIEQLAQQFIETVAHWVYEVVECLKRYYSLTLSLWFLTIIIIAVVANYIKG